LAFPYVNRRIHFSLLWIFHQSTLTHALKSVEVVAQVCLKICQSRLTNKPNDEGNLFGGRTLDISEKREINEISKPPSTKEPIF
jgi:hypothetical protein